MKHFVQSYYAMDFLKSNGISSLLLSDPIPLYTSKQYLSELPQRLKAAIRSNTILYTNLDSHVKEVTVKQSQFRDAESLLHKKGTTLGSSRVISYPINGKCLIIEEEQ